METPSNRARVEAELHEKTGDIEDRIEGREDVTVGIGGNLWKTLRENPLLAVGGVVAIGLVYAILSKRKRNRRIGTGDEHKAIIEAYIDAIINDARHAVASGEEAGEAIREALQDRVPVIVYSPGKAAATAGMLRQMLELTVTTAVGFAIRSGMERLASSLDSSGVLPVAGDLTGSVHEDTVKPGDV